MRIDALDAPAGISAVSGAMPVAGHTRMSEDEILQEAFRQGLISSTELKALTEARRGGKAKTSRPAAKPSTTSIGYLRHIVQMLKLETNKFYVLRLLQRNDWIRLLYLLPKKLLLNGLRFFDKGKLMMMIMWLPPQLLLKIILRLFNIEQLVLRMPTSELMRILRAGKLDNRELLKGIRRMPPQFILLLLARIHGDQQFDKMHDYDLWQWIMRTPKHRLMQGLKTLPFKALVPMVIDLVKRDPQLLLLLSEDFLTRQFDRVSKRDLIDACEILPEELLIKMLSNLPDASLMEVAAEVDNHSLEDYLISRQSSLLQSLGGQVAA